MGEPWAGYVSLAASSPSVPFSLHATFHPPNLSLLHACTLPALPSSGPCAAPPHAHTHTLLSLGVPSGLSFWTALETVGSAALGASPAGTLTPPICLPPAALMYPFAKSSPFHFTAPVPDPGDAAERRPHQPTDSQPGAAEHQARLSRQCWSEIPSSCLVDAIPCGLPPCSRGLQLP